MRIARLVVSLLLWPALVWAGPVIIDGTDSNDHGHCFDSSSPLDGDCDDFGIDVNKDGWLYMQKALENIAAELDPSVTKVVVNLGGEDDPDPLLYDAYDAIHAAFALSTLPGDGWTITDVDGASAIDIWLAAISTTNTGILAITTAGLYTSNPANQGDLTEADLNALNARATDVAGFVNSGGALFSLGEIDRGSAVGYGWLTTVLPGIVVTQYTSGGVGTALTLTATGTAEFPGLTSGDLSTGPWHSSFSGDLGGLVALFTGIVLGGTPPFPNQGGTVNVGIGGGAGTSFSVDDAWGWTHRP